MKNRFFPAAGWSRAAIVLDSRFGVFTDPKTAPHINTLSVRICGIYYYKGFPTSASNSHPGSIAQQLTQERMFRFSLQAKFVAGAAGY
ncbi:MAG: hypothetical protein U1F04_02250 [Burkholderiaceae bacterium]